MANQFRVRRGLIVNGSGSALLDIQGSQGQLFSVTDQLSGSLFSVSDASGIPVLEAFSDTSVRLGLYGAEAIIVSGSNARITGSLLGTASFALSASWAPGGGGGGSLTGGAADYVAVWNSTTTLTTRSLYDNGNVGIGTTAPVSRLQISGSNTEAILRINSPASASILVVSGSGFIGIGTTTPTTLLHVSGTTGGVFEVDGASAINAFYVSSSGNVGIGTTNTTFRLFVTGSTNTVNFKGSGSAVFSVDGTSGRLFQVDDSLTGSLFSVNTAAGLPLIEAFSDNTVLIGQYGQNTLYVSQSRVGIGTTIPASRLHVSGTTGGAFQVNGAAATLAFYVSASGRVGIGTTTLLNTFHVVGTGRFTDSLAVSTAVSTGDAFIELGTGRSASGNAYLDLVGDTTYTDYGLRIIRGSAGANATSEITHRGTGGFAIRLEEAAAMTFSTTNTARLTILSGGNVGIGTTSPGSTLQINGNAVIGYAASTAAPTNGLQVSGSIAVNTTLASWASTFRVLQIGARTALFNSDINFTGLYNNIYYDGAAYRYLTTAAASSIELGGGVITFGTVASGTALATATGAERMRINNDGNIGIGTSTASSILHVSGTTGGVFRVNGAAAVNALFVSASGDVGIGTSAPTTQTNYRFLQVNGTNSAVIEAVVNGTRIGGFDSDASSLYVGTIGSFPLIFRTAVNERMRVSTNGFVSIGTTAAPEKLTLHSGSIKLLSLQNVANDYRYIGTEYDAGNGNNRAEIRFAIDGGDTNTRLTFHTAAGGGTINEVMRITSGGSVGIGTTAPTAKLQVDGNVNIIANSTPTITVPNGTAGVINTGGSTIINYYGSVTSPYTQNIQIDIVYSNWGGNNTVSLVDLMASLREWGNTPGVAFGKIFASQTGASTTFSTFNTTNITTSQCAVTAASGGNYTLRITINPDNNTDVYSLSLNIHMGGTGTTVSSVTISLV